MRQGSPAMLMVAVLVLAAVAGCSHATVEIHRQEWAWGPGVPTRNDPEGNPFFHGPFRSDHEGRWTLDVESRVDAGTFRVQVRGPDGFVEALAEGDGRQTLEGRPGSWSIEIVTGPDDRGRPAGLLELVITGR